VKYRHVAILAAAAAGWALHHEKRQHRDEPEMLFRRSVMLAEAFAIYSAV
jgi:hypothetical protein